MISLNNPIKIGLATTNSFKIIETQAFFDMYASRPVIIIQLPPSKPVEESGNTFQANAYLKLKASLEQYQAHLVSENFDWVMAEDSGLVIDALAGTFNLNPFPGVTSDRWLDPIEHQQPYLEQPLHPHQLTYEHKNQVILQLMQSQANRHASYIAVVSVYQLNTGSFYTFEGSVPLTVAEKSRGNGGFGYDPIMMPMHVDSQRTMAELSLAEKSAISHRNRALAAFLEKLITASESE